MTSILAVTGPSGAGKSSLAHALANDYNTRHTDGKAVVLTLDAYYRDLAHLTDEQREKVNFDHPDSIEFELVAAHLAALRSGETITVPRYDFTRHTRASGGTSVDAHELVVFEGLLLPAYPGLRPLIDHMIYVDLDAEQCLNRRIERDVRERGRTEASVRDFWLTRAFPMFQQFVAPAREEADLVVSGEQPLAVSVQQVRSFLNL